MFYCIIKLLWQEIKLSKYLSFRELGTHKIARCAYCNRRSARNQGHGSPKNMSTLFAKTAIFLKYFEIDERTHFVIIADIRNIVGFLGFSKVKYVDMAGSGDGFILLVCLREVQYN